MNLRELLDELKNNILRDVSDQISPGDRNEMWSEATMVHYINEAQNRFCIKTGYIRDETTPAICKIVLVPGQDTYVLDPRVIKVFNARMDGRNLRAGTYGALFANSGDQVISSIYNDCDISRWQEQPDNYPTLYYTDRETQKLGVYPRPGLRSDGKVLTLRVSRRPLEPLVLSNLSGVPEIPEDHHMDLLEWAAWKCLRNHDVDAENIPKGSTHAKRFDEAVKEVAAEMKRLQTQDVQFELHNNWSRG